MATHQRQRYAPIDGIPVERLELERQRDDHRCRDRRLAVSRPASALKAGRRTSPTPAADNYSDVTFEYDPCRLDYWIANGDLPGPETPATRRTSRCPTAAALERSATTHRRVRAARSEQHRQHAADPRHRVLLLDRPAGLARPIAANINVAAWTRDRRSGTPTVPGQQQLQVLPERRDRGRSDARRQLQAVRRHGDLRRPTQQPDARVRASTTTATPAARFYYQSPNGTFTTPKLGTVKIGKKAVRHRRQGRGSRHRSRAPTRRPARSS